MVAADVAYRLAKRALELAEPYKPGFYGRGWDVLSSSNSRSRVFKSSSEEDLAALALVVLDDPVGVRKLHHPVVQQLEQ